MVGRVSFVILSGIVAAAALVHVLPKDNSADLAGGAKIVPQIVGAGELNADVGTHEAVVVAMDRVDTISFSGVPVLAPTISRALTAQGIFMLIRLPVMNAR